jgi:hypothetical protein
LVPAQVNVTSTHTVAAPRGHGLEFRMTLADHERMSSVATAQLHRYGRSNMSMIVGVQATVARKWELPRRRESAGAMLKRRTRRFVAALLDKVDAPGPAACRSAANPVFRS